MTTTATHQTYIYIGFAGEGDAIGPGGLPVIAF